MCRVVPSERRSKTGLTQNDVATLRRGLRGPPARHATLERRALTRDLTRATRAPMSEQMTSFSASL
eukprot:5891033-Pyramimonas_sp.AAC.1